VLADEEVAVVQGGCGEGDDDLVLLVGGRERAIGGRTSFPLGLGSGMVIFSRG
jgi:hypothetical protein